MLLAAALVATPALAAVACGGAIETTEAGATPPAEPTDDLDDGATPFSDARRRDEGGPDVSRNADAEVEDVAIGPLPDGSLSDGVCRHPTGHKSLFDPDCVYVVGTFAEGAVGNSVFFEPEHPADHRGGVLEFGSTAAFVRPTDNRLLSGAAGVRIFAADGVLANGRYPHEPAAAANDPVVSTPACPDAAKLVGIFPDDGVAIYRCRFGLPYLEGSTVPLAGLELGLKALGPMRTALVIPPTGASRIWSNGVDVPITGLPTGANVLAARYGGASRFFVAVVGPSASPGPSALQQWTITFAGVATHVGDYLNPNKLVTGFESALDPAGNLYRVSSQNFHDRVMRFSVVAAPTVAYDEEYPDGGKRPIRLHGSSLFTGP